MKLFNDEIILRDMTESDIDDHILWRTEKTEWMNWDAPWRYREKSKKLLRERLERKLGGLYEPDDIRYDFAYDLRLSFEICLNDEEQTHIGWLNTYRIYDVPELKDKLAIGIALPEIDMRGKGYGTAALRLYMDYLFGNGYNELYMQTWSGNERMIHVAQKLGFTECDRQVNARTVNGTYYDVLTFRLKKE